ncbi:methylitaconate delta2-delta3-isomerase [Periconia macrospinosa]|uniref:Methylitaconate delta2-delta3-isomerase n=1 Tax=Periconia macrospinosa TaxID=97972 RepID=A0A2V1E910_9PLEO|nr:methylitaconate delta2-delta3-isomerase [Periconia macrospinosa]
MMAPERASKRIRCSMPAVLMRAGTSKGLFIHRHHLPVSEAEWKGPLLAAMGSQNSDARQIDGIGGATSTTSKVAVISPSTRPGIDVDYTFVQVAVGQENVDFSGNCGNMCSGVGPFALQEGLVRANPGDRTIDVRIFNTNTSRVIIDTVEVDDTGSFEEDGDYSIPGVKGTGSEIKVSFMSPAGSMTGKLFPTGKRSESILVSHQNESPFSIKATLIDAANPFVLVDETTLPPFLKTCNRDTPGFLSHMESIRRAGAVLMGLASSESEAAQVRGTPKLAILSPPSSSCTQYPSPKKLNHEGNPRIRVLAFSMGKPHPSLQLTGAACLASAVCVEGTVAHRLAFEKVNQNGWKILTPERTPSPSASEDSEGQPVVLPQSETQIVSIEHQSGSIDVEVATSDENSDDVVVESCAVSRTARRLFEGTVYYYQNMM